MPRVIKIILIIFGALLAVVLLSSIAGHITLDSYLGKRLGRDVRASFVYANPLTGAVYVRNLRCNEIDSDTVFASVNSLSVRINPYALFVRKVSISGVELNGLDLSIVNNDTSFNFSDIPGRFVSSDEDTADVNNPWVVSINSISLDNTAVSYSDPSRNIRWQIGGISLTAPGINIDPEHKKAGISLQLPEGGGAASVGWHYEEPTNMFTLSFDADSINPNTLLPILKQHIQIVDVKAILSAGIKVQGSLDDIIASHISGTLDITNVELFDEPQHVFAKCKGMNIDVKDVSLKTMQIDVNLLKIDSLMLDLIKTRQGGTLANVLSLAGESDKKTSTQSDTANDSLVYNGQRLETGNMRVRVGDLDIEHASVFYDDRTLPSKFQYTISDIKALGKEIDTQSTSNHIIVNGNLPEGGNVTLTWRGGLNPLNSVSEVVGMLRNVKLRLLSPWTMHIFGYAIQAGTLNFTSDNTISYGKLTTNSTIEIFKPEVGKKRKSGKPLIDVPLKLGIGLMKNQDDNIILQVSVSGDLKRKNFHLADELGKAVGQAVKEAILPSQKNNKTDKAKAKSAASNTPKASVAKPASQPQQTATQQSEPNKKQIREEKREERRKRREERRQERNR